MPHMRIFASRIDTRVFFNGDSFHFAERFFDSRKAFSFHGKYYDCKKK
jgi:hypothetical protein